MVFPPDLSRGESLWQNLRLQQLGLAAYFQLDPLVLRAASYSEHTPVLGTRGEWLPSVLANIAATDRDLLERIESDLRDVVPQCRRIRTPHAAVAQVEPRTVTIDGQTSVTFQSKTYGGHRLEVEVAGAGYLGADLLSEGTLIVLALLTALHTSPDRKVFLLDDIERALHPSAQKELITALRRFLDKRPDAQILCTSHSPYIIDHFEAEEVCVMRADKDGHATCQRLADHPEWLEWKARLGVGEFWTSVGEAWVEGS
jgi:predicted ATPase